MILNNLFGAESRSKIVVTGADVARDATLKEVFGVSGETTSGVEVDETVAMNLSAVYDAVRQLSWTPAQLPLFVYERLPNRDKREVTDHPVFELLHNQPNLEMSAMAFRELGQIFVMLWGNSISWIERTGDGRPKALWPLHPGKVQVLRERPGEIIYDITRVPPEERPTSKGFLMPSEVLHVPGLGFNGIVGQSVLHFAREQLGEAVAAQNFGAGFYAGGASPILAIKHPIALKESTAEKLRRNWEGVHGGSKRRIAVLDENMDLASVGMPQKDMQFLDSRLFYTMEVARWFGIPPHRLKDLSRATYSNIEEQQQEWYEALVPWLVRWEQEINRKLFTEAERKALFCEHVTEGLLRGDVEKRYNAYATAVQWGWMNRNEVRRRENLNQIGEEGDEYMVPVNMQPASQLTMPQETMKNAIAQTT